MNKSQSFEKKNKKEKSKQGYFGLITYFGSIKTTLIKVVLFAQALPKKCYLIFEPLFNIVVMSAGQNNMSWMDITKTMFRSSVFLVIWLVSVNTSQGWMSISTNVLAEHFKGECPAPS